jgi:hypothetical protein
MKQNLNNRKLTLKLYQLMKLLLLIAACFYSFAFKQNLDDLWKELGMEQQTANTNIRESFLSGYLYTYGAKNIKNVATGDKVAIAKNLLEYTRQYVNTEFKALYEKQRISSKPVEPQLTPLRTKEEIQKEEVAKLEASIKQTEEDFKSMNEDMKKIFTPIIAQNKKMLEDYKKPDNQLWELLARGEKDNQERQISDYKTAAKDWEVKYPEDYKIIIKERLQKVLAVTKDVDFNAALKEQYEKKKFVNPAYEAKSSEWKMAFRAGKEVTEVTRAFAQQWLNEIK